MVNTAVVSPSDSSLWIATNARGLVRVGKNGKAFSYSSEKGDFANNNIVSLSFDNEGVLWFKDAGGSVYSYTSFSGFVLQNQVPQNIAQALSEPVLTEEQAPAPVPEPQARPWFGSWCFLLLTVLLLIYAVYTLFKGRGKAEKPAAPNTLDTETDAPSHSVLKPEPSKPVVVKPSVPRPEAPKHTVSKPVVGVPESGSFYEKVYAIAKENFTNPDFGVEDVATALGMSRVHLNRKLKAENSPSPSDVIKSMRMELAADMLKKGELNISDIASKSGFSSASYFSSAFKEYFGVAPAAYGK